MSNLRLIGLIVGIAGLVTTFLVYRGARWNRANFLFFSFFNIFLITITINPASINFLRDMLALEDQQRGRLLALLILSNIFLLFFTFYSKSRIENLRIQFDRLVRSMGVVALEKAAQLNDRIKPITVVIPALNEAENLKHVLRSIPKHIGEVEVGVLVVDDGSEDTTREVALASGGMVVSNPINRGGGAALRLGYDILKKANVNYCVTMDADGQHRPEEIQTLLAPILNGEADFVIGSRVLGNRERDSLFRLSGVYFFGWLMSALLGKKITDPSSGFRAFRMDRTHDINLLEDQYHTSELIIEAIKKNLRIREVPVTILKRRFGKSKKGRDLIYGFHFAKTILKTWWR
jgi:cellulose synthase/poly-beta-1,6-N-acetylglucosamine synthase-like glycosyltransferase